jgi:hypothetical protein
MNVIKCTKLDSCPICGKDGSLQVFFNKQNQVKYGRVRHYIMKNETDYNPQVKYNFRYHRIEDLNTLETLLHSVNFQFPIAQAKHPVQAKSNSHVELVSKPKNLDQHNLSSNIELEPRAGFDPATITLPR